MNASEENLTEKSLRICYHWNREAYSGFTKILSVNELSANWN